MQRADAQGWLDAIKEQLPDGATFELHTEPMVIDVDKLTDSHIGEKIRVYVNNELGEVSGTLDHVFIRGGDSAQSRRTLVIDGRAYGPSAYATAVLSEW